MGQRIKRVGVVEVERGMYIVQEDAEDLTTDEQVNADYDADEQDWQHVIHTIHKADVSQLVLAYYNGEQYTTSWGTGIVWLLVDENGEPVVQDPED